MEIVRAIIDQPSPLLHLREFKEVLDFYLKSSTTLPKAITTVHLHLIFKSSQSLFLLLDFLVKQAKPDLSSLFLNPSAATIELTLFLKDSTESIQYH